MAVMNFDLEDGLPPVKITLNIEDTERFVVFMHECEQIRNTPQRTPLTDEEIEKLIFKSGGHKSTQNLMSNPMQVREHIELWDERIYAFARAIESARGIKGEA